MSIIHLFLDWESHKNPKSQCGIFFIPSNGPMKTKIHRNGTGLYVIYDTDTRETYKPIPCFHQWRRPMKRMVCGRAMRNFWAEICKPSHCVFVRNHGRMSRMVQAESDWRMSRLLAGFKVLEVEFPRNHAARRKYQTEFEARYGQLDQLLEHGNRR